MENFFSNRFFWRVLRTDYGNIRILISSGGGGLKYLFKKMKNIDPVLLNNAKTLVKKDNIVWDVGANLGLFTFFSSLIVGKKGRVIAFEPDTLLINVLRESAQKQRNYENITIVPTAVGAENAIRTFAIAKRARASNHLIDYGHSQTGGVRCYQTVSCISLDWALNFYPVPDVLKIDVEGAEMEVLVGAIEIIGKKRPTLLIEVSTENAEKIGNFLRLHRYSIFDGDTDPQMLIPLKNPTWNTIAIPD